jgi:hypothetical protein
VLDAAGKVVRRYEKGVNQEPDPRQAGNWPDYWIRPWPFLDPAAGLHRFVWDLRLPRPAVSNFEFPISAIPGRTTPVPLGPLMAPGTFTIRLTVDGRSYTQPLRVRMDPRVKTPAIDLRARQAVVMSTYEGISASARILAAVRSLREQLADRESKAPQLAEALRAVARKLDLFDGGTRSEGRGGGRGTGGETLTTLRDELAALYDVMEAADRAPTRQASAAAHGRLDRLATLTSTWQSIQARDIPAVNAKLRSAGLESVR